MNSIKPEKKNRFLNVGLTPSMDEKIQAFADKYNVNRSEAARYILERFFESDFENIEAAPVMDSKNETNFENFGVAS